MGFTPKINEDNSSRFSKLKHDIENWATDRGIIANATPASQLLKAASEFGELCDAENKGQHDEAVDAVGDVLVCIINYCAIKQYDIEDCLSLAYEEIKDRKGYLTKDGCFVKE
jgi:NTP pyrophosphatase (non-canonical NTP hydrolase)